MFIHMDILGINKCNAIHINNKIIGLNYQINRIKEFRLGQKL